MHENFDLHSAARRKGADVFEREFARQHNASEAQFLHGQNTLEVVGHELRGGVQCKPGEVAAHEACHAEILDDQSVGGELVEDCELFHGLRHLALVDHRVERDVCLFPFGMCDGEEIAQLFGREVHGVSARGEGVKAEIHGVSAGSKGCEGRFERACGGEELYFA